MFICLTSAYEYETKRDDRQLDMLIAAVGTGDREALAELYSLTQVAVYSFCLSLLKNAQDAEDALHDTYLDLFRSAEGYQTKGKPMAWIITVAKNRCLMRIRDRQKTAELPAEDWDRVSDTAAATDLNDRIALEACLQKLTDEERQIVVLHAVSGLKHREIARVLEKPLSTVLSKYHRAMKKLKVFLAEGESA